MCAIDSKKFQTPAQMTRLREISVTINGENKTFHDEVKFKQYLSTNTTLHKMLEGKIYPRRLTTHMKTQKIDNITLSAKPKGSRVHEHTCPCTHIYESRW